LQRDVGELLQAGDLADGDVLRTGPVLDRRYFQVQPGDLGERPADRRPVVTHARDDDLEVVDGVGVVPDDRRHRSSPSLLSAVGDGRRAGSGAAARAQVSWASRVFCWIRKMTNSAGKTGATPITQIRRPFCRSSSVIVVRSQATKNASAAVVPARAPLRQVV